MPSTLLFRLGLLLAPFAALAACGEALPDGPDPRINEFVLNHSGRDTREYIEISGVADTDYSRLTLIVLDGDDGGTGIIETVSPVGTTGPAGLWTTGYLDDRIGNGSATLLLVEGFQGGSGFDLDTDDDGALDARLFQRIVDAVAVTDADAGDRTYADVVLKPGLGDSPFPVGGASRLSSGEWARNDFDGSGLPELQGSLDTREAQNTPGRPNRVLEPYPGLVMLGTVVTMTSEDAVLEDGAVLVVNGIIEALWDESDGPPSDVDVAGLETIDTGAIIFPGLIDLHNHLSWNALPPWEVAPVFEDRYQWRDADGYGPNARWPATILNEDSYAGLGEEVMKYAEVRALVGGTTSAQGSPPHREAYGSLLVRNLDYANFGVDRVYSTVADVRRINEGHPLHDLLAEERLDAYFLHVAEGTNDASHGEFNVIREGGLLTERLALIHGVALERRDFREMAAAGAVLVWSPSSNLALYGETADVAAAVEEGVRVSLAPDWGVTGSANLLAELKVADGWNREHVDPPISDLGLVRMATTNPAEALGWQDRVGTIRPGMSADLMVIRGHDGDPYRALIEASERDVLLVTVEGDPLYGRLDWMKRLKPGDYESIGCEGFERGLDVTRELIDQGDQSWREIVSALEEAMRFEGWVDDPNFPGLRPLAPAPVLETCG